MSELVRFGVSLEKELLERFDDLIRRRKYTNRSEALRDMIRQELLKQEWKAGGEIAGAITFIYDHHTRELLSKITDIQHDSQEVIISSQHIHLDHHNCLEIIAVKGRVKRVLKLADSLKAIKGVQHCALNMTGTGGNGNVTFSAGSQATVRGTFSGVYL
ncbi:MAG: nickel-responsive transcriptional regulator NikR [Smithellaceae bacterium]